MSSNADVGKFLNQLSGGGFRPNRYEVNFTFPKAINEITKYTPNEQIYPEGADATRAKANNITNLQAIKDHVSFMAKGTKIPSMQIGEIELPYKGRKLKVNGDVTLDDWEVTLIMDSNGKSRGLFEFWMEAMLGVYTNTTSRSLMNPANYMGTATVRALGRDDELEAIYVLSDIYPKNVGEIALAWDSNDQVAEVNVTFAVNNVRSRYTKPLA